MSAPESSDGGARMRTRRAILDAATTVFAETPGASLADVATAAGVGRSTLHRHFAERSDLMRALALHVHAMSNDAIARAEPDQGPPAAALRRVVECQLSLGPIVPFVYTNPTLWADTELAPILDTGDEAIVEILDRAATGRPAGPPGWPRLVFWALLNAGYGAVKDGVSRVAVVDAIMTTLVHGAIDIR